MGLQWTTALSVGVPEIDAQHRELFGRVDALLDAMLANDRSVSARTLAFLREYAAVHFGAEEALMRELDYPGLASHAAEHQAFTAEVDDLGRQLEREGTSAALLLELERRVCDWLRDHVYFTDVALGRFVTSVRRGQPAR